MSDKMDSGRAQLSEDWHQRLARDAAQMEEAERLAQQSTERNMNRQMQMGQIQGNVPPSGLAGEMQQQQVAFRWGFPGGARSGILYVGPISINLWITFARIVESSILAVGITFSVWATLKLLGGISIMAP